MNKHNPKITLSDWHQWLGNPVTIAYVNLLAVEMDRLNEEMLNYDPSAHKDDLAQYALKCATLRAQVSGLRKAIDFDLLKLDLVSEENEE